MKSVKEIDAEKCGVPLQDDGSVAVGPVKKLLGKIAAQFGVRDGDW